MVEGELTFSIQAPVTFPFTVTYSTRPASATSGVDYGDVAGEITFEPGEEEKSVPIPVYGDGELEGDEYLAIDYSVDHELIAVRPRNYLAHLGALAPPERSVVERFGETLSIAGPTVVVGSAAPGVFVYGLSALNRFEHEATLVPAGGSEGFGRTHTAGGGRVFVGDPAAGEVYVFAPAGGGSGWDQVGMLDGPAGFGSSLATAGGSLFVGAPGHEVAPGGEGAVFVFTNRAGTGEPDDWGLDQVIEAPGGETPATDFGRVVAAAEDVLAVGAPGAEHSAIYLYEPGPGPGGSGWTGAGRLTLPPGAEPELLGHNVGVSPDGNHVGAYSITAVEAAVQQVVRGYVFTRDQSAGPTSWLAAREIEAVNRREDGYSPPPIGLHDGMIMLSEPARHRFFGFTLPPDHARWGEEVSTRGRDAAYLSASAHDSYGGAFAVDADRLVVAAPESVRADGGTGEVFTYTFVQRVFEITDDEVPGFSVTDVSVSEPDGGSVTATFEVTLDVRRAIPVSVGYETAPGSAGEGEDFVPVSGILEFAPQENRKTVAVEVLADGFFEGDETFELLLLNPSVGYLAKPSGVATISDPWAVLEVSDAMVYEPAGGAAVLSIPLLLSKPLDRPVTVTAALLPVTATAGEDYASPPPGGVTGVVAAGSLIGSIDIDVMSDAEAEPVELLGVRVTAVENARLDRREPFLGRVRVAGLEPPSGRLAVDGDRVVAEADSRDPLSHILSFDESTGEAALVAEIPAAGPFHLDAGRVIAGNEVFVRTGAGGGGGLEVWERAGFLSSEIQRENQIGGRVGVSSIDRDGPLLVASSVDYRGGEPGALGAVFVFEEDSAAATGWREVARVRSPLAGFDERFGYSVAIDGDWLAVGAPGPDKFLSSVEDVVYLFHRDAGGEGAWGHVQTLRADEPRDTAEFGVGLDMEGGVLFIADAERRPPLPTLASLPGAVTIYELDGGGETWAHAVSGLQPSSLHARISRLGRDVTMLSPGKFAVGYRRTGDEEAPVPRVGGVAVFEELPPGSGAWVQTREIEGVNPSWSGSTGDIAVGAEGALIITTDGPDIVLSGGGEHARGAILPAGFQFSLAPLEDVNEVDERWRLSTIPLALDPPPPVRARFSAVAHGGTSEPGLDFEHPAAPIVFQAGSAVADFEFRSIDDNLNEPDESAVYAIIDSNVSGRDVGTTLAITIEDDDEISVSVDPTSRQTAEGDAPHELELEVRFGGAEGAVHYETVPGTAVPYLDFEPVAGVAELPGEPGSFNVKIPILGDTKYEWFPTESFNLVFTALTGGAIGGSDVTRIEIEDDDAAVTVFPAGVPDGYTLVQGETLVADGAPGGLPALTGNDATGVVVADATTGAAFGALELNAAGQFTYTPEPNFIGTDTFSYEAVIEAGRVEHSFSSDDVEWRYLNPLDGLDPELGSPGFRDTWMAPGFDDGGWETGRGFFFYGDITGAPSPGEATYTELETPPDGMRYTAYFRTSFELPQPGYYSATCRVLRDDGIIVYLDGQEWFRDYRQAFGRPGEFETAPDTFELGVGSPSGSNGEEDRVHSVPAGMQLLTAGSHTLAVSVHNTNAQSSDLALYFAEIQLSAAQASANTGVTIEVTDAGLPPVLAPDRFETTGLREFDSSADGVSVLANDGLVNPATGEAYDPVLELESRVLGGGALLAFDTSTGHFRFAPEPGLLGDAEFEYRARDKDGWSAWCTVTVAVSDALPRDEWRREQFGYPVDPSISGERADPDLDGRPNLIEYAFGTDPLDPASQPPDLTAGVADGQAYAEFLAPVLQPQDVRLYLQSSDSLGQADGWTNQAWRLPSQENWNSRSGIILSVTPADDDYVLIRASDGFALGSHRAYRFMVQ